MILRAPTEDENGGVSLHTALIFKGIRHSRMLLSGIQETGTGPPIETFGGDVFGSRDQFTPNPKFSKEHTKKKSKNKFLGRFLLLVNAYYYT